MLWIAYNKLSSWKYYDIFKFIIDIAISNILQFSPLLKPLFRDII